nr:PepSY-like domain-containing protein [uncultured Flavobacterium sp.]
MRNVIIALFFYGSTLTGQNAILLPPDSVINAFENQYPNKKVVWSVEAGQTEDDVNFEAKFSTGKIVEYALYDKNGVFKRYKTPIPFVNLPRNIQTYINKNYPRLIRQNFYFLDDRNEKGYMVEVKKTTQIILFCSILQGITGKNQ